MKKFLMTASAAALVLGVGAPASAQSVLERVLAQTSSLGEVTGVFANVADNIGGVGSVDVYVNELADTVITADEFNSLVDTVGTNRASEISFTPVYDTSTGEISGYTVDDSGTPTGSVPSGTVSLSAAEAFRDAEVNSARQTEMDKYTADTIAAGATGGIDGSITNVATRIDQATANVDNQVTAISDVTANFGNMSTTVLGAVNTGEIGLGTNQLVEEAIASSSEAVRSTVTQVGTTVGTTQLAINSALNTTAINGSISNTLTGVNGSVAAVSPDQLDIIASVDGAVTLAGLDQLLGTMSTTVLGAVNTGTIVSGVNNQVTGTVAGIVGNSATNMFAEAPAAGN